jgi:DNA-binding NtrC family response regulator
MKSILVGYSDPGICQDIKRILSSEYKVETCFTKDQCLKKFESRRYDFTFLDVTWPNSIDGKPSIAEYRKFLKTFWRVFPAAQIIIVTPHRFLRETVMLVKAGANNYLTTPLNGEEVKYILESTDESTRLQLELDYLRDRFWQDDSLEIIRTNSAIMKKTFEKVRYVAPTKTTVLLTGETGVGKGVIARLIHRHSDRQNQPFIHVHCGAIPENLVESELFGHERGAFTGAVKRKLGRFEIAKGGTIFLDEIGTISSSTQIKMLQVLQDRIFQRIGSEEDTEADVRIIAASNYDLKQLSEKGYFRTDLYYRLSVFPIEIPSLRHRVEDIPLLIDFFLQKLNTVHLKDITDVHPLVLEAMKEYSWPGNIREFENILERAYILENSSVLTPENFPQELFDADGSTTNVMLDTTQTLAETRRLSIEQIERHYLIEQLSKQKGKINKTADAAGISTRQLHKLLTKYRIRKEEFRSSLISQK